MQHEEEEEEEEEAHTIDAIFDLRRHLALVKPDSDRYAMLSRYVVRDFDRLASNDEDYTFKLKRCVREFVRAAASVCHELEPDDRARLLTACNRAVRTCASWMHDDAYCAETLSALSAVPQTSMGAELRLTNVQDNARRIKRA